MRPRFPLLLSFISITCGNFLSSKAPQPSLDPSPSEWTTYLQTSEDSRDLLKSRLSEFKEHSPTLKLLRPPSGGKFPKVSRLDPEWFLSADGRHYIESVISFQCPNGGWSKAIDFSQGPRKPNMAFGSSESWTSTIDNGATVPQLRLLCRDVALETDSGPSRKAALRAFDYLLAAQYPNGGWPQIYPLAGGYHDHITYNDDAMTEVLELLLDVSLGEDDFTWLPSDTKKGIDQALTKGIQCVLASQYRSDSQRYGWAQQVDRTTLQPAPARAFEMVSLSSKETASIIDFLIRIPNPDTEVISAVDDASEWLSTISIEGYDYQRSKSGERSLVSNPDGEPIWARFYEIGSNRPLFGDRDNSIHYELSEISAERRNGYAWYVRDPASTLKRVAKWKRALQQSN